MIVETAESAALVKEKNFGIPPSQPNTPIGGDPINFATGNAYTKEVDLDLSGPGLPMRYVRYYNSQREQTEYLGYGWTGSFSEQLTIEADKVILREADGKEVHFPDDGTGTGTFVSEADQVRTITSETGGYLLTEPDGGTFSFDTAGKLVQIADRNGNIQTVTYDANNRIASVADNFSRELTFFYDAQGRLETLTTPIGDFFYTYDPESACDPDCNLIEVAKPDLTTRQYQYTDPNYPRNLTGIVNENNTLFHEFTYDTDGQDRATGTTFKGGTYSVEIDYPDDLSRLVTDGRGNVTDFTLEAKHGMGRVASSTGSGCSTCPAASSGSFSTNPRFQIETATDNLGHTTRYTYDDRGNIRILTEAEGTADERTTTFIWHPDFALPTYVTRPSVSGGTVTDSYTYYPNGNLHILTEAEGTADARTTTFTWDDFGRMTFFDGPRTDVTDTVTFSHYPAVDGGYLHTITNAKNQTTTFSNYNGFGKPEQVTDANGVVTTFGYDGMGRMTSRTTAGLTTGYTYDDAGRLTRITLPGNREIIYGYTDANLLESITDNAGNTIHYLYDDEGNRTWEEVRDAGGVLQKYVDYEHDAFNRLWKVIYPGDDSPYEEYLYDGNDNLKSFRNANGHVTEYLYDALDRLESEIRPGAVTTGLDHDAADNLTLVTDPGTNTTVYTHDDLGRTTQVDSPDTGITVYGHDPAGNVTARTDANGVTVTYGYDALNRLIMASFPGGGEDFAFGYDAGAYGKGRLTSAADAAGSTTFTHDALGRVTEEARVTDGISYATGYAYSATTGDLTGMTYPTGLALTFQRDAVGRISGVTAGGQTITGNVVYLPFGPVEAMDLGAVSLTRIHDARYQVIGIQAGTALNYTYTRDGMGNISGLSGAAKPPFASGTTDYAYAANRMVSSTGAEPAAYTYDNAGNITSDGARDFIYNQNNRLVRVETGGTVLAEYAYDGFERRVKKVAGGVTVHYHYDLSGRLISETDGAGNPIRDYVYIDGEPVAMQVYGAGAGWYWFLNDHLGTPQKLVDDAGAVVWQAAYMPFGEARILTADVENNLRFPGQYYDAETGLHYNWHRYYDPETGRYLRPDPIGLAGGINLYVYALNNPANLWDYLGLNSLGEQIASRIRWQIKAGGIRPETGKILTFEDNFTSGDKEVLKFAGSIGTVATGVYLRNTNIVREGMKVMVNTAPYTTSEMLGGNTNNIPYDYQIYYQIIKGIVSNWPRDDVGPFFFKEEQHSCP